VIKLAKVTDVIEYFVRKVILETGTEAKVGFLREIDLNQARSLE